VLHILICMNYIKIDQCWKKSTSRIASIITRQQEEQAIIQFFFFRMVWESRHDQGRSNTCLIHPELVVVRCYVQYACTNHAFPLSQSIHHVNRIENRTKLARCCKCPCLDIPFLAKFVGSRCILGGLLFVLPLLETLKVWGWLSTRLLHNCQDLDHCWLSQKLKWTSFMVIFTGTQSV
jgi:hypothetical protein